MDGSLPALARVRELGCSGPAVAPLCTFSDLASLISREESPFVCAAGPLVPLTRARLLRLISTELQLPQLLQRAVTRRRDGRLRLGVAVPSSPVAAVALFAAIHWGTCCPVSPTGDAEEIVADLLAFGVDAVLLLRSPGPRKRVLCPFPPTSRRGC